MADYPYALNTRKLRNFMSRIGEVGVPPKITVKWLEAAGLKSKNDRAIIGVLKFIDFINNDGVPTNEYKNYRGSEKGPLVLGLAIRKAYSELYEMYPEAHSKDSSTLENFFSTRSNLGAVARRAMVNTFQTLCGLASFETQPEIIVKGSELEEAPFSESGIAQQRAFGFQTLAINIQIALPETTNAAVYEEIFKAMKRYLLDGIQ